MSTLQALPASVTIATPSQIVHGAPVAEEIEVLPAYCSKGGVTQSVYPKAAE
jgi:hypothetical protein